jgi:prepilin-type N-terminal cleavage/methylation domain-containing protein/prepilin-type processing-associated H-X9-DG protein
MFISHKKKISGFTLVELLVVISIIALLVSILMPALGKARAQARQVLCASNLKQIGLGIEIFVADSEGFKYPQQRLPVGTWNVGEQENHWWLAIRRYVDSEFISPNPNASSETVGHCPNHTESPPGVDYYSYVGNSNIMTNAGAGVFNPPEKPIAASSVMFPSEKVIVFEIHTPSTIPWTANAWMSGGWLKPSGWNGSGPIYPFGIQTHGHVSNFLFCDGHVESVHGDTLADVKVHWYPRGVEKKVP